MGKGDRKSRKGKIAMGSFGKTRPSKRNQSNFVPQQAQPNTTDTALEASKAEAPKAEKAAKKPAKKKTSTTKAKATAKKSGNKK